MGAVGEHRFIAVLPKILDMSDLERVKWVTVHSRLNGKVLECQTSRLRTPAPKSER